MTTPHPQADLLRKQMQQDFIEQGWTYIAQSSPAAKRARLERIVSRHGLAQTKRK